MVNRIWPTAVVGEADSVSFMSALAYHIGGQNSVNPGQILLFYGNGSLVYSSQTLSRTNKKDVFVRAHKQPI